jgi:hypothetical protein
MRIVSVENVPADFVILTQRRIKLKTTEGEERIKRFIVDLGIFAAQNGLLAEVAL